MRLPRPPDWLIFSGVVLVLLFAAAGLPERADAPAGGVLPPASPFDPEVVVSAAPARGPQKGTAFSVSSGVWITARHVVAGCKRLVIVTGAGQGVVAQARIDRSSEAAVLFTKGGTPGLPIAPEPVLRRGMRASHPGFPGGEPGEAESRLIGRQVLRRGHGWIGGEPILAWAEISRAARPRGALVGLSGAPALDGAGEVVGVTIAEAPRRGRLYTTTTRAIREALRQAGVGALAPAPPVSTVNYSLAANALRRELRVAQVVCLAD